MRPRVKALWPVTPATYSGLYKLVKSPEATSPGIACAVSQGVSLLGFSNQQPKQLLASPSESMSPHLPPLRSCRSWLLAAKLPRSPLFHPIGRKQPTRNYHGEKRNDLPSSTLSYLIPILSSYAHNEWGLRLGSQD